MPVVLPARILAGSPPEALAGLPTTPSATVTGGVMPMLAAAVTTTASSVGGRTSGKHRAGAVTPGGAVLVALVAAVAVPRPSLKKMRMGSLR